MSPTHTINTAKTVAVSTVQRWLKLGPDTPCGVKLQLISRGANVGQYGVYDGKPGFFTHWAPTPTWEGVDEDI